ncbi:MAG: M48 family metallopeptidase [Gammaproteobacteria bacterium]|nr:M48 family metallopeptidase [Gammaproteobacteria bacterium]
MERNFYLPGLRTRFERLLDILAQAPEHDPDASRANILALLRECQDALQRQDLSVAQLSPPNRAIVNWLAYFASPETCRTYTSAVVAVQQAFAAIHPSRQRVRPPVWVHFRPRRALYQFRGLRQGTSVTLPTPMVIFEPTLFKALAELVTGDRQQRQVIQTALLREDYQSLQSHLEDSGVTEDDTAAGQVYDLASAFARLNNTFFASTLERPRLIWSRRLTRRKFGHYDSVRDTVMLSSTLDHPEVPAFVVDFVLYHELLHKKHGVAWRNGRARVHTPEFRREERRFPKHAEAEAWLKRLAGG